MKGVVLWQINNGHFYTIFRVSSQIYGWTLRDIMMWKCWARNKTEFFLFLLQWSTISIHSHWISSHNTFCRLNAINLKIFIGMTTPDAIYTLLAFCSSFWEPVISHMNGSHHAFNLTFPLVNERSFSIILSLMYF